MSAQLVCGACGGKGDSCPPAAGTGVAGRPVSEPQAELSELQGGWTLSPSVRLQRRLCFWRGPSHKPAPGPDAGVPWGSVSDTVLSEGLRDLLQLDFIAGEQDCQPARRARAPGVLLGAVRCVRVSSTAGGPCCTPT